MLRMTVEASVKCRSCYKKKLKKRNSMNRNRLCMTDEASVKCRYCYIERYHAQAAIVHVNSLFL